VLRLRAADVIVLKPSALGGPTAALAAAARIRAAGLAAFATTLLDGAVARASALAVAAVLPEPHLACGLATGELLARDLADFPVVVRGEVALARTPGLGVVLDGARLEACSDGAPLEVAA
jgi:L-alanine-DL-glutamate epimerase-like enolase superfamily enzyme